MTIYVAEVNGRAIAAFPSDSQEAAEAFVGGKNNDGNAFRADLHVFELWDQASATLTARPASKFESEEWSASLAKAQQNGQVDDESDWRCFFVNGQTRSRQDFGSSSWTLKDISRKLAEIDLVMLMTHTHEGGISGRPMNNGRNDEYRGETYFLTSNRTRMVADIERNRSVALSYCGLEKPTISITVQGEAELVRDKDAFKAHWTDDLTRWFPRGLDTPDLILIRIRASRIHYWDGEKEGEVKL